MKKYVCEDGTVYANAGWDYLSIDELIEFLEEHRGKGFYNTAAADLAFCVDENYVRCDELDTLLEGIEDEELYEEICEALEA